MTEAQNIKLTEEYKTFKNLPFLLRFFESPKESNHGSEPRILGFVSPIKNKCIKIKNKVKLKSVKDNTKQFPFYLKKDLNKIISDNSYKKINTTNNLISSRKKTSVNKLSNLEKQSLNGEKSKNDNINININITGYASPKQINHINVTKNNKTFLGNKLFNKKNNKELFNLHRNINKNMKNTKKDKSSHNRTETNVKLIENNKNSKKSNYSCLSNDSEGKSKLNLSRKEPIQYYKVKKICFRNNKPNKYKNYYFTYNNKTPDNKNIKNSLIDNDSQKYYSILLNSNSNNEKDVDINNVITSILLSPKYANYYKKFKNGNKDINKIKCPEEQHFFHVNNIQKSKKLKFDTISEATIE